MEGLSINTLLRHTFAKYIGDLNLLSELLGYSRIETAAKYIAPRGENITEVVEKSSLNVH